MENKVKHYKNRNIFLTCKKKFLYKKLAISKNSPLVDSLNFFECFTYSVPIIEISQMSPEILEMIVPYFFSYTLNIRHSLGHIYSQKNWFVLVGRYRCLESIYLLGGKILTNNVEIISLLLCRNNQIRSIWKTICMTSRIIPQVSTKFINLLIFQDSYIKFRNWFRDSTLEIQFWPMKTRFIIFISIKLLQLFKSLIELLTLTHKSLHVFTTEWTYIHFMNADYYILVGIQQFTIIFSRKSSNRWWLQIYLEKMFNVLHKLKCFCCLFLFCWVIYNNSLYNINNLIESLAFIFSKSKKKGRV